MFWDEDNRLMVLSDNGKTSRYTYNAGGERIIKSHGSMEGVYINGAPQGITFHETDEFTLYPASIITVNRHRFTKHYFIGDKRVASRLGLGEFRNVYGSNGSNVTAGQQDYAERMNQIEQKREEYYKLAGVAPGLPTMKGSYADPEVTGVGYNVLIKELGDHRVPENWVQHPVINTEVGSNPGAPLAWGSPENPDDVVAGYGYVACDTSDVEETFYYHSDHLGSTAYITDQKANVTQYDAYLPYGELLVDEHSSSAEMPYKFNGKELDEETGLYYYGARYMNPITSMWYGVDPLCEQYVATGAYVYCVGNPIALIDPDGQKYIYNMQGQFLRKEGDNNLVYIDSNGRLSPLMDHGQHMNDRQFNIAAHIVDQESGGDATESLWIAHTANNAVSDRDVNWGKDRNKTLFEQLNDRNYSTTPDAAHDPYDKNQHSASRNSARAAIIDALVSSVDPTGGCVLWDGTDFLAWGLEGPADKNGHRRAHAKFREYKTISIDQKTFDRYCEGQFKKYPKGFTTYLNQNTRKRERFNIPASVFRNPNNWGSNGFSYSYSKAAKRAFSLRAQNAFGGTVFWKKERDK